MRYALWRASWRERLADLCQAASYRLDPIRPVLLRGRSDLSGADWEVWVDGRPTHRVSPDFRQPSALADFRPRWRS